MPALTLPASAASSWLARSFVTAWLEAWDLQELGERARLATSELATNAIQHTGLIFDVRIEPEGTGVRVEVSDQVNEQLNLAMTPSSEPAHGRGLRIVASVTNDLGMHLIPGDGKTIWFQVDPAP